MEKPAHTPISQSRNVNIARSSLSAKSKSGSTGFREDYRRNISLNHASPTIIPSTDVSNIVQGRSKEKKDMQELNQRFGSYIEKVRFLEAQNRKLVTELTTLRERWGQETGKIKTLYEGEMKQLRKLLDETEKNKAELQVRETAMEDQLSEIQIQLNDAKEQEKADEETIEKMNQTVTQHEGEISILRKRVSRFDEERARDKKEIDRLRKEIARLCQELEQETLAHINAENECQTAQEELEFQRQIHESELKELASLAYRDTTEENRDYWKAELSQALHDMQTEYDNKLEIIRSEMDSVYSKKLSEMRSSSSRGSLEYNHLKDDNGRIKTQLSNLRTRIPELENKNAALEAQIKEHLREIEEQKRDHDMELNSLNEEFMSTRSELTQVLEELQSLLDMKLSLELEIVAYRKLLEGEEARSNESMKLQKENRMDLVLPPKLKVNENSASLSVNNHSSEATIPQKSENLLKAEAKTTDESSMLIESSTTKSSSHGRSIHKPELSQDSDTPSTDMKLKRDGENSMPSPKEDNTASVRERKSSHGSFSSSSSRSTRSSPPTDGLTRASWCVCPTKIHEFLYHTDIEQVLKSNLLFTRTIPEYSQSGFGRQGNPVSSSGELSAKTTFQRSAKGNVSIKESAGDGSRIVVENTGSKKQDISGWTVKRDVDNSRQVVSFKLPSNTVLESDGSRKVLFIWAKGSKPKGSPDLECNDATWGVGKQLVITTLLNEKGEERANHTAKTVYS